MPPPEAFRRVIRPRCDVTMVEQIDRPRPNPPSLVVKNGSKIRFSSASGIPGPRSLTETSTFPSSVSLVTILSMRSGVGVEAIASTAFIRRLIRTCCNSTESPDIGGNPSLNSVSTLILRITNSECRSCSAETSRSFKLIRASRRSPFFSSLRRCRITRSAPVFLDDLFEDLRDVGQFRVVCSELRLRCLCIRENRCEGLT